MDSKTIMKGMMELFKQMDKALDEIEERQRRWLDPKRKVRPREQLEERKSTQLDFSFLRSLPNPEPTKSKRVEPSKSVSEVQKAVKSDSVFPRVFPIEKNVPKEEQQNSEFSEVFPIEKNVPKEEQQNSEFSEVLPMEENVQEEEQQNSDFSEVLPKEENVREEEQYESEFSSILEEEKSDPEVSNVVSMEQNVPEKKEYDSEFSDDSYIEQNVPGEGKRVSEFSLKENVHNSGEVIDFIFPMSTFIQTNHALDLRTNPFQEEEYDVILTSTSIDPSHERAGLARRAQITEYEDGLNKLIKEFWAKPNTWRPIELNYAQWGLCKVFRQFGYDNGFGAADDMSSDHGTMTREDGAKEGAWTSGPITRSKAKIMEETWGKTMGSLFTTNEVQIDDTIKSFNVSTCEEALDIKEDT